MRGAGILRVVPVVALLLTACDRPLIRGVVVDVQGETLPGVAVKVTGSDRNALTNALGEYEIRYRPGPVQLEFYKSGYTPGHLELTVPETRRMSATPVRLWRLPSRAGVFLYENHRYRETTRVEPKRYFLENGDLVYGTKRSPELTTPNDLPVIICYRMPRYDARLTRLEPTPAKISAADTELSDIRADGGTMRLDLTPIDALEATLLQLELDQPLHSGVYAVHWGALEGEPVLDSRIHMFEVVLPEPEPAEGTGEAEGIVEP